MNINMNIRHITTSEDMGEYIDIAFTNDTQTLYFDIIRKLVCSEEEWEKALQLKSEPLEFIDYFLTMKI